MEFHKISNVGELKKALSFYKDEERIYVESSTALWDRIRFVQEKRESDNKFILVLQGIPYVPEDKS